jgi:hypothetical protein
VTVATPMEEEDAAEMARIVMLLEGGITTGAV